MEGDADAETFATSQAGVFACGDCVTGRMSWSRPPEPGSGRGADPPVSHACSRGAEEDRFKSLFAQLKYTTERADRTIAAQQARLKMLDRRTRHTFAEVEEASRLTKRGEARAAPLLSDRYDRARSEGNSVAMITRPSTLRRY